MIFNQDIYHKLINSYKIYRKIVLRYAFQLCFFFFFVNIVKAKMLFSKIQILCNTQHIALILLLLPKIIFPINILHCVDLVFMGTNN